MGRFSCFIADMYKGYSKTRSLEEQNYQINIFATIVTDQIYVFLVLFFKALIHSDAVKRLCSQEIQYVPLG